MKLKNLQISLNRSYEDNPGKYRGHVEYEGDKGSVSLVLDEGVSEALLLCVGEVVVKFSQKVAEQLRNEIILSVEESKKTPVIEESVS